MPATLHPCQNFEGLLSAKVGPQQKHIHVPDAEFIKEMQMRLIFTDFEVRRCVAALSLGRARCVRHIMHRPGSKFTPLARSTQSASPLEDSLQLRAETGLAGMFVNGTCKFLASEDSGSRQEHTPVFVDLDTRYSHIRQLQACSKKVCFCGAHDKPCPCQSVPFCVTAMTVEHGADEALSPVLPSPRTCTYVKSS